MQIADLARSWYRNVTTCCSCHNKDNHAVDHRSKCGFCLRMNWTIYLACWTSWFWHLHVWACEERPWLRMKLYRGTVFMHDLLIEIVSLSAHDTTDRKSKSSWVQYKTWKTYKLNDVMGYEKPRKTGQYSCRKFGVPGTKKRLITSRRPSLAGGSCRSMKTLVHFVW